MEKHIGGGPHALDKLFQYYYVCKTEKKSSGGLLLEVRSATGREIKVTMEIIFNRLAAGDSCRIAGRFCAGIKNGGRVMPKPWPIVSGAAAGDGIPPGPA